MSAIEPALTPEEWQEELASPTLGQRIESAAGGASLDGFAGPLRHALAALALQGQPYGFTREDADGLRALAESLLRNLGDKVPVAPLLSLADRIEALLPPR